MRNLMGDYYLRRLLVYVTARTLPVVNLDGEAYFFDARLSQLRHIQDPHKFIDLSPSERKYILEAMIHLQLTLRSGNGPTSRTSKENNV
jgi:hypothetical protein